jgi:hypothetical protein
MRSLSAAVAPLVLVALAGVSPWAVAAFGSETEHVTRTIALEPGGTLRLKSFSGRVTITASDRSEVTVDAVRRASRERLDNIKLEIHRKAIRSCRREPPERGWYSPQQRRRNRLRH